MTSPSLAIQDYLRTPGNDLETLASEFSINVYRHPGGLPLVGMKYSQINSPKYHPIVRDARGIVLEEGTWDVIAKPFRRFYNPGEDQESFKAFDWSDFTCTTKEDGSLILLSYYKGSWMVNTSGSFGLGECNFSGKTWRELFWETSGVRSERLDPDLTYIFELCTNFNKVVRIYPKPTVFLLSAFYTKVLAEQSVDACDWLAEDLDVTRPERHSFSSMDEITEFLEGKSKLDPTFEGVVIRDSRGERFKVKSRTYLAIHNLYDNGNVFNPKRLVPLILAGEVAEILAYFPSARTHSDRVRGEMEAAYGELRDLWVATKDIGSQRDFAMAIVKKNPFSGLLFTLRKNCGESQTESDLRAAWQASGDAIIKVLYS